MIPKLPPGATIWVDYHETIYDRRTESLNLSLIEALRSAQQSGVKVVLWTGASFDATIQIVQWLKKRGLVFDDIQCNVPKPDLIIDDKAVPP